MCCKACIVQSLVFFKVRGKNRENVTFKFNTKESNLSMIDVELIRYCFKVHKLLHYNRVC